jgi:hypothetical protein
LTSSQITTRSQFHPLNEHRYFCPWICSSNSEVDSVDSISDLTQKSQSSSLCGWQLFVNSVFRKFPSSSSVRNNSE